MRPHSGGEGTFEGYSDGNPACGGEDEGQKRFRKGEGLRVEPTCVVFTSQIKWPSSAVSQWAATGNGRPSLSHFRVTIRNLIP
jgi:hypothetical protein